MIVARVVTFLINACIRLALVLLTDCRVEGRENVPATGPVLVVSNHLHNLDPGVLIGVFPRHLCFMAKKELMDIPIVGWGARMYGAFAIKRGASDREAIRTALSILQQGKVLAVFPEGHRSKDGRLQRGNAGAGMLALRSGASVVPVVLSGTDTALRRFWRRPRIVALIGEPFRVADAAGSGRINAQTCADLIMRRLAGLLPPDRRGPYEDVAVASSTGSESCG